MLSDLKYKTISLLIFINIILNPLILLPVRASTSWHSDIESDTSYCWIASKAELRDNNLYYDNDLFGSINVPKGTFSIYLKTKPRTDFNFLKGDRLRLMPFR